jgi:hypothetical protein
MGKMAMWCFLGPLSNISDWTLDGSAVSSHLMPLNQPLQQQQHVKGCECCCHPITLQTLLPLCRFNYCPSNPATQGATILALPKHKVYKGAPNFVYAVFSADQILAALPGEQRRGLAATNFKQCGAAPPQWDADAAGNAAYFVCDVSAQAGWLPFGNGSVVDISEYDGA